MSHTAMTIGQPVAPPPGYMVRMPYSAPPVVPYATPYNIMDGTQQFVFPPMLLKKHVCCPPPGIDPETGALKTRTFPSVAMKWDP